MNPEKPSREEIEAKLTALLLGELPAEEAQLLRWAISQDAALARLHDRLKLTVGFVREAAANPAETIPAQTAPLKLSAERREKLLAHFKTIAPKEFVPLMPPLKKRREMPSLFAMAAAIALVALLAAMLLPSLSSAKRKAQRATSQANASINNTRQTDGTVNEWALENKKPSVEATTPPPVVTTFTTEPTLAPPVAIVLPQTQNSLAVVTAPGQELAVASPPPSDNFNFGLAGDNSIRDQNVLTVQNASPQEAGQVLQNMFGSSAAQTSPLATRQLQTPGQTFAAGGNAGGGSGFGGSGGGGVGGSRGNGQFMLWRAPAATPTAPTGAASAAEAPAFQFGTGNNSPGELENKTLSGKLAFDDTGVSANDDRSRFYRSIAPDSAGDKKDKVPFLGDLPLAGRLFQSRSANKEREINGYDATPPAATQSASVVSGAVGYNSVATNWSGQMAVPTFNNSGSIALADDLSKAGGGTVTLDGLNAYNGTLNAPDSFATTNAVALNWQLGAQVTADSDTHNLVVIADKETQDQIQSTLKNLDQVPVAAMPAHALPDAGVDSRAPAPTVAPPVVVNAWPGVVGQNRVYMRSMPVFSTTAGTQGSPGSSIVTYTNMVVADGAAVDADRPLPKAPSPAPVPTPEILTRENAFSTFSLNVSDVSFKLAAASLERGQLPDAASIRSEEFINAFDYRDPEPAAGVPVAFVSERARDPFAHNRDLLRFSLKTAAAGREAGRPLNIVLLLDNSGSMERADRVAIIHEALKVLASQLQPQDTLSIVTFARTARLWVDGARGDQAGTAVNKVSDLTPEGGTNLEEAMNLAYATARRHYLANGGNRVVLLTDGAANLGNVDPEALKQKVESFRKQGIALDCFGIGWEGYNDDLLEVLSSNGDGRYGFINTPEAATTEFAAQLAGALHVEAEDVKVQVEFNPQRVISYRQIGYAKHQLTKEQFRDNTVAAAPMAAREAGNALYTVEINPQGEGPVATVRVRFRIPGTTDVSEHEWAVPFDGTAPALEKSSPALRLAATASAFSEWLASSPFAQEVTTDQLLNYLNGVPAIYGADARLKQLETMIREAKSISGK